MKILNKKDETVYFYFQPLYTENQADLKLLILTEYLTSLYTPLNYYKSPEKNSSKSIF